VRLSRIAIAVACLLAAGSMLAACGSDSDDPRTTADVADRPAPPASEFPETAGQSLGEVVENASGPAQVVISPAAMVFNPGPNRYSFGVFELDRTQIPDAEVALYIAKVPPADSSVIPEGAEQGGATGGTGKSGATGATGTTGIVGSGGGEDSTKLPKKLATALDQPAIGPFTAEIESLETEPAFRAQTTSNDPDAALAVYKTSIDFPSAGEWRVAALIKDGEELKGTLLPSAVVGQFSQVPQVGEKAPRINTPTREDVSDVSEITTRVPPDTQNEADFADVLGQKPIVLLFATPQFCQSRVCGPVVDVAEQVKESYGDEVEFIHMEVFEDNEPSKGVRPQVKAFNLPSEPWLFVIDREGVVRTAIEGAFGVSELEGAVREVTQ
jgi:hypothetical protein